MAYRSFLDRLGLHRPELRAWALYDVANSAWMTTIIMIFPLFFYRVAASDLAPEVARSRYAFAVAISTILVGLVGPVLGCFILVPISELLREIGTLRIVFYSLSLVAFIVFRSEGLMVYGRRKYHQFERWVKV